MPTKYSEYKYPGNTFAAVRMGAMHKREDKPCQDAALVWRGRLPQGQVTMLAVADGHGDAKYDLSHAGAALAVKTALSCLRSLCRRFADSDSLLYDAIRHDFANRLTRQWRQAVRKDFAGRQAASALSSDIGCLAEDNCTDKGEHPDNYADVYRRYGTTLIFALAYDDCLIGGQIGDGDMTVTHHNQRVGRPVPVAENLIANETHSLISADSTRLWRFCRWTLHEPCLICLSTDGLSNGFGSDRAFDGFLCNLVGNIDQYGFVKTSRLVPEFLDRVSAQGSGDDVTLAMFWQASPKKRAKSNEIDINSRTQEQSDVKY